MAQFDVHRNASRGSVKEFPYLLDVQSDLLDEIDTRVVVPLTDGRNINQPISRLHPRFTVEGIELIMLTAQIAGVPKQALGVKVESLAARRDAIIAAIDVLITGV